MMAMAPYTVPKEYELPTELTPPSNPNNYNDNYGPS